MIDNSDFSYNAYHLLGEIKYSNRTAKELYFPLGARLRLTSEEFVLFIRQLSGKKYLSILNVDDKAVLEIMPEGLNFLKEWDAKLKADSDSYRKRLELKEQEKKREIEKEKDHKAWIDKKFTYCNTIEAFMRIMAANKRSLPLNEYTQLLLKWQDKYGNSSHCYSIWGPDYLSKSHNDIYRQIISELDEINSNALLQNVANKGDSKIRPDFQHRLQVDTAMLVIIKPTFKPEAIDDIFVRLKDFFSPEQQPAFKLLLETGDNAKSPLLFKDNGNRIAGAFRELIENDIIIGCKKQDLEAWISKNFKYTHKGNSKIFTPDYIEKCISRNHSISKKPLFKIKNGVIQKD